MSRKVRNSGIDQRQRIIMTAARQMSQKGFKGASIQDIADAVGIHKSTFFHYFNNKQELLAIVLAISVDEVTNNLKLIIQDTKSPPLEKLWRAIRNHLKLLAQYIDNVNVYHNDIGYLMGPKRTKYFKARRYYVACFQKLIEEVQESESGYFKGLDSKIVALGILGMCNWVAKWYKDDGPFDIEYIAEVFFKMITQSGSR